MPLDTAAVALHGISSPINTVLQKKIPLKTTALVTPIVVVSL